MMTPRALSRQQLRACAQHLRALQRSQTVAAPAAAPIEKILVANRGEIACRIINSARRMGIKTTAVYCDAEMNGKHVAMADEAFRLGPPPATSSYLRKDKVIEIAKAAGAQAIHPGYGFLSENAEFAELCAQNGIQFIGPPASAITSMGSKSESKNIMIAARVPVIPGYQGEDQDPAFLAEQADLIGYPVLIKAAAGGGGRGMRLVPHRENFMEMLEAAKREATKYFADDEVILEKFIERSRHVEVQVFADKLGGCVYLFERDCSVQRRHQKILEEAPAPLLSDTKRREMGQVAVAAARAVNYIGAGTVEFLYDPETDNFYFMEMNTRLQVEHPVTEAITKLDLVELQIKVARGEPLPFTQDQISYTGHAIEARIYAEDPSSSFLPGSGRLQVVQLPPTTCEGRPVVAADAGEVEVRVDSGFQEGDDVLVHYDSMISKLIVWAKDRETALVHLHQALEQYKVVGVPTNIEFLKRAVLHPVYQNPQRLTTNFLQDHQQELLDDPGPSPADYAMALLAVWWHEMVPPRGNQAQCMARAVGTFRVNDPVEIRVDFQAEGGGVASVCGTPMGQGKWALFDRRAGWELEAVVRVPGSGPGAKFVAWMDGQRLEWAASVDDAAVHLLKATCQVTLQRTVMPEGFGEVGSDLGHGARVLAPMPGKIVKVLKAVGDRVEKGDTLMILEAMKMEHAITVAGAGVVDMIAKEGDMVGNKQQIALVEPQAEEQAPGVGAV